MNVPNLSQPGLTCETSAVPRMTPGSRPMTIGSTRRQTRGSDVTIHPEHVSVERDFDRDERRVEDAVGEKQQRDRDGNGREPVPERTVDYGRAERDDRERELSRVHRIVVYPASLCVLVATVSTACTIGRSKRSFSLRPRWDLCRYPRQLILSLRIRARSVWGLILSRRAAPCGPSTRPWVACSAASM